jgi:hypothetical protein
MAADRRRLAATGGPPARPPNGIAGAEWERPSGDRLPVRNHTDGHGAISILCPGAALQ